jgi:hypothetical protein
LIESNLYKKKRNRFQFDSIKIEVPSFIDIWCNIDMLNDYVNKQSINRISDS